MANQTDQQTDVAVLGAGPAGCAAALCLSRYQNIRVHVIDRKRASEKAGEVLPPGTDRLLDYLGVPDDTIQPARIPQHRSLSAWGSNQLEERAHLFGASGSGWALDRFAFDSCLRNEVLGRGISINDAAIREIIETEDGWHLMGVAQPSGSRFSLKTKFLIDASGRSSRFARRRAGSVKSSDQLVAIWQRFRASASNVSGFRSATLVETTPDGWWYSSDLPDSTLVAAFFTTPDFLRQSKARTPGGWQQALQKTAHTQDRLSHADAPGEPLVFPAQSSCLEQCHGQNWVACGDAAFTADPLSSIGISMALLTGAHAGRLAAEAVNGGSILECSYSAEIQRNFQEHQARRKQIYALETRWPDYPFWKYWQNSNQRSHTVVVT